MERSFWSEQGWEWDVHIENESQDKEERDNKQGDRHFELKGNPHDTRNHISTERKHRLDNETQSTQEEEKVGVLHPVKTTGQERRERTHGGRRKQTKREKEEE